MQLNWRAQQLFETIMQQQTLLHVDPHRIQGADVVDFGVHARGGIEAGLALARLCLADLAEVRLIHSPPGGVASRLLPLGVLVATDHPVWACLGGQYAGWPVQAGSYFAMGSGPMRLARGREEVLEKLQLSHVETSQTEVDLKVVGVLEAQALPTADVVQEIAAQCSVTPDQVMVAVAPVTSLAGTVQVVARSVETALHKVFSLGIDPHKIHSGVGVAPLPPTARTIVDGIGRTNDAILYGAHVTLWVDMEPAVVEQIGPQIPSQTSHDHGRPFAEIFKNYDYDFYKVDPHLFSPAVVTLINCQTGESRTFGRFAPEVLCRSFGLDESPSSIAGTGEGN